ncbi:MAG TPA: hypothetical protein VGN86_00515 [Pyrinomonadaceae bacterium]|jgi:hypothetical protein|nr:hypothetical protein [Pyrinomonadaceae bacterium]
MGTVYEAIDLRLDRNRSEATSKHTTLFKIILNETQARATSDEGIFATITSVHEVFGDMVIQVLKDLRIAEKLATHFGD